MTTLQADTIFLFP